MKKKKQKLSVLRETFQEAAYNGKRKIKISKQKKPSNNHHDLTITILRGSEITISILQPKMLTPRNFKKLVISRKLWSLEEGNLSQRRIQG